MSASPRETVCGLTRLSASAPDAPPDVCLAVTLAYLVAVVSFPPGALSALVPFSIYPLVGIVRGGIPFNRLARRVAPALPFLLFAGLPGIWLRPAPHVTVGSFPVSEGWVLFLSLLLKGCLCVGAAYVLACRVPLPRLGAVLARFRVPGVFVAVFLLIARYIDLFFAETVRLFNAYRLRAPGVKGVALRDIGPFAGHLTLRSFDRADRVSSAMILRSADAGTGALFHLCSPLPVSSRADWARGGAWIFLFAVLRCVNISREAGAWFL